jgi:peptide/nickel transport system ATP-binding protein
VQAGIVQLFADLRSQLGVSIFFIAHDLAVVRHLCDRVAVMYMGKIVEEASTDEIFSNPRHPYTRALLDSIPRLHPDAYEQVVAPEGEPPSLSRLPSGCRFRSRCPYATEKCSSEEPSFLVVTTADANSSHLASCHYANDLEAYRGRDRPS